MAFVGPYHGPKILGKNHQSTAEVTLNEPAIIKKEELGRGLFPEYFIIISSFLVHSTTQATLFHTFAEFRPIVNL